MSCIIISNLLVLVSGEKNERNVMPGIKLRAKRGGKRVEQERAIETEALSHSNHMSIF